MTTRPSNEINWAEKSLLLTRLFIVHPFPTSFFTVFGIKIGHLPYLWDEGHCLVDNVYEEMYNIYFLVSVETTLNNETLLCSLPYSSPSSGPRINDS